MINLALFAFVTGAHLALLQFSFFFLLLINVTSTYITYMTIVLSWMAGTLLGLWWRRLGAIPSLVAGIFSYYVVYGLVISDPLSPSTLAIAALGVAISGLWAGRFFIELFPRLSRVDRLFFHENNGFLLGVVGVFVGFTLLGRPFLLWTPLLSGMALTGHLIWIRRRLPEQPIAPPLPAGTLGAISHTLRAHSRRLALLMCAINVLVPAGMLVHAALIGEDYWDTFARARSALTWLSSAQLLLIGAIAYANYEVVGLLGRLELGSAGRRWVWLLLAVGFACLAVDERFELSQALTLAVPTAVGEVGTGALGLVLYVGFALVVTLLLRRHFTKARRSLLAFVSALLLAGSVAIIGHLPASTTFNWPAGHFWSSAFDDVGALWAQFLFLLSFLLVLYGQFRRLEEVQ